MPATRYISKQLADWSVLDRSGPADRGGAAKRLRPCEGAPRPGIGVRAIEQGYPIRTVHQEIPF